MKIIPRWATVLGALTLPAGVVLLFLLPKALYQNRALAALVSLLIGYGGTLLAFSAVGWLREKRRPGTAAEDAAMLKDERGQLINGKAATVAFLAAEASQIALMLYFLFSLLQVPSLLMAAALLAQAIAMALARWHYGKTM